MSHLSQVNDPDTLEGNPCAEKIGKINFNHHSESKTLNDKLTLKSVSIQIFSSTTSLVTHGANLLLLVLMFG